MTEKVTVIDPHPKGSIVIISHNNIHLTKAAVRAAQIQSEPCRVLVIDNASTDGTVPWLKSKEITTISYRVQRALSQCWNIGLRAFWLAERDRVLVLNNDVDIRPDTYEILSNMVDRGCPFVTGVPVTEWEQRGHKADRNWDALYESRHRHPHFSCFMIHQSVTDQVGYFDEGYYVYCEDSDYHVRMHRAGIEAVCIDLPFYHGGSWTIKTAEKGEQERIQRHAADSRKRFKSLYGCSPDDPEYDELFRPCHI